MGPLLNARATLAVLALLVACFALEVGVGWASLGPWLKPPIPVLVALGGVVRHLVLDRGEWWRLVAGPLLHGDLVHIGMNALVILLAGVPLERRIGPARWLALYVAGGTLGAVGSTFINPANTVSAGASGAALALLGALFVQSFAEPDRKRRLLLRIDSLRFLVPSLLPAAAHGDPTDLAAHVGGTLAGLLLGWVVIATASRPAASWVARALGAGAVAFVAAGVALTAREAPGQLVRQGVAGVDGLQGPLRTACGLGSRSACIALGGALASGEGLPRDVEGARRLLGDLCEREGQPEACFYLGLSFQRATPPDLVRAAAAFEKGCAKDELSSCFNLAIVLGRAHPVAEVGPRMRALLERACTAIPRACSELALHLAEDEPKQPEQALALAKKTCELKEGLACFIAGWLTGTGQGTPRDDDRARIFLEHACHLGEFRGCDAAGMVWLEGRGVEPDARRAATFFELACASGEPEPCYHLALLLKDGKGTVKDEGRARSYLEHACEGGYPPACRALEAAGQ